MIKQFQKRFKPYLAAFFSIAIAVFAVLLVSAVSGTGSAMIEDELSSLGLNGLTISGISTNKLGLSGEEILGTVCAQREIGSVSPATAESVQVHMAGKNQEALAWGVSSEADDIIALELLHGRIFTKQQVQNADKVCLVDESIAQKSYGRSNIVGKTVNLALNGIETPFTVIGVVRAGSSVLSGIAGQVVPNFVYVPYTTLLQYGYKKAIDQIAFLPAAGYPSEEIKSILAEKYPPEETGLHINDLAQQKEKITSIVSIASWALALLAAIALVVAGVSVMSSVSAAILVRRKEIGIKKAMGARISTLIGEFLGEIFTVAVLGAACGFLVSGAVTFLCLKLCHLEMVLNMQLILAGLCATVMLALLFGIVPVVKAARMRPVEALNRE